jgi:TRAP-type C4-dicarboxylate transport system permease small subunit
MKLVRKFINIFDRTLDLLALLAIVLIIFVMLAVDTEVVTRYFWGRPITGTLEVIAYCLLFITFLGTAWVLREEAHVRMDIVLTRLKLGTQHLLNIITSIISAAICFIIMWYGVRVTWETFQMGLRAATELETPEYLVLFIIPIGSFLLFIQFLRRTYGYLHSWRVQRASGDKEQSL